MADPGPLTFDKFEQGIKKLIGPPTPEETALLNQEIALGAERLAAIKSQSGMQSSLMTSMGFNPITGVYDPSKATLKPGGIDPESSKLVDDIYGQEMKNALEQVTQVTAPARGLRPTDTPIQDRSFRVAGTIGAESARAKLDLSQRAFLNRLGLIEGTGQMGLGLATATGSSPGTVATNLQGNRYSVAPTSINQSGMGFDPSKVDWGSLFDKAQDFFT